MEAEANVDEEGDKSSKGNDQTKSLPMRGIATIWTVNISFHVADDQEPENAWNEVLDEETVVECEGRFPPLESMLLLSTQLGH